MCPVHNEHGNIANNLILGKFKMSSTNMATKTKLLSLSSVHANYLENFSRSLTCYADSYENKSDKQKLAGLIAESGWSPTETLGATLMTPDEITVAVAQREGTWSTLRELVSLATSESDTVYKVKTTNAVGLDDDDQDDNYTTQVSAKMELSAFERLYTKGGKVIVPEYSLVWGFRRTGVLPLVNAVRADQHEEEITKMSYVIMTFDNITQRHEINILENTNKSTGLKALSAVDCLSAAKIRFDEGATQATLRKTFSHGTGQKLHAFLTLNAMHLGLDLYNRCLQSSDIDGKKNTQYIKFSALNKEKLRTLCGIEKGKNVCDAATQTEVNTYVSNPNDDQPEKVITMSKTDLALFARQHPSKIVQMLMSAVATNDKDMIKSFNTMADDLNALAQKHGLLETIPSDEPSH